MRVALTVGLLMTAVGCGDGKKPGDVNAPIADSRFIVSLVSEVLDSSEKQVGQFFTADQKGKVGKAEYKKLTSYTYSVEGQPAVTGDAATAQVRVTGQDGKELGTKEWAFAREGGKWKIKSAPLP